MKKIFNQYIFMIIPAVVISIVMIVSVKFVFPGVTGIFDKQNEIKTLKDKLSRLEAKNQTLIQITSDNRKSVLTEVTIALPNEKDAHTILNAMENLSSQNQFMFDSLSFNPGLISSASGGSKPVVGQAIRRGAPYINFSVNLRGTSSNFENFISNLSESRRLFDVQSLAISFDRTNGDNVTTNLSLVAYYLPIVEKIGAVEADLPKITKNEEEYLNQVVNFPDMTSFATSSISGTLQVPTGKANLFSW